MSLAVAPCKRVVQNTNMKDKHESPELEELEEGVRAKQRNTTWPDTLLNGRSVDEFLWKGPSDATLIQ